MAVSIKNKIRLGTVFLLLLLMISGGLSIYYLVSLTDASKIILKNNYESLSYGHAMLKDLDNGKYHSFDSSLLLQEHNITEPGEKETTEQVRFLFKRVSSGDTAQATRNALKEDILNILALNMQAIEKKNGLATLSAENAYAGIIVIVSITLLIGLVFAFNFPAVVVTPIEKLMEAIKEISIKNYKHRIHLDNKDEFGRLADAFNTMSERLEEFENSNLNKLIFEKSRAEAVINSLQDASIGIDKNDKVLFANEKALQLLHLTKDETIGKTVAFVSAQNDLFRFLVENETNAPFKIVVEGKENFYMREQIDVQQENTGSKVIILKNITSFKEMDVAKTNFIATVSHELKTPLASSDFSLKLLEDDRVGLLSNEQKELVEQLKKDNQRMLRILSELLNMSQVEAGKIQINLQQVNPYTIAEISVQAMQTPAKEKGISIHSFIEENLSDIEADPDKVTWILNNLLTNAIKFSPDGAIVELHVSASGNSVIFMVTDKGPGIEESYKNRIFERYFQIPGRSDKKGSGIGLAICKEFVEAMGGKIWLVSSPGNGSSFGFSLPSSSR